MELFVLGFILGMGVMLLLQSIAKGMQNATQRRRDNFQAAVNAEVSRRMQEAKDDSWLDAPGPSVWDRPSPDARRNRAFQPITHP